MPAVSRVQQGEETTSKHKAHLRRRIAWGLQAQVHGGLSPLAQGKIAELADTRLLHGRLSHHFAAMIRAGDVADCADLARLTGFTRARITQMMDLTLLAPDIQEQILMWSRVRGERGAPSKKRVLAVAREWERQRERWGLVWGRREGR
jgi:alkylated DNA nucleotide flippase Atl1